MNPIDAGRVPPHDLAAEVSVLGCALLNPEHALPLVSDLRADDFFLPVHREAWAALLAVEERRVPVDVLSVGDEIRSRGMDGRFEGGWMTWATGAASKVQAWQHVAHHAAIVREKATLRRMLALAAEVSCRCYNGEPVAAVMEQARDGVAALEVDGHDGGPVRIGDALGGAIEVIESRRMGKGSQLVMTGLETLDQEIGGLAPEELIVVAGRPGHGKTAFADGVATWNGFADVPNLIFSLEMSEQQLVERILSLRSGVPASYLRSGREADGKALDRETFKRLTTASGDLQPIPLWIDSRPLSLGRIVGEARRWHAREVRGRGLKLGLIAVDYLQLVSVETENRERSREQQVARISKTLKWLAKDLKLPVLAMSQLNREIEKRGGEPVLSDLRESGAIEQDADIILCPWRVLDEEDPDAKKKDGPAKIIVLKNRGGPTGWAPAFWRAQTMAFESDWSRSKYEPQRASGRDPPPANWQDGRDER